MAGTATARRLNVRRRTRKLMRDRQLTRDSRFQSVDNLYEIFTRYFDGAFDGQAGEKES